MLGLFYLSVKKNSNGAVDQTCAVCNGHEGLTATQRGAAAGAGFDSSLLAACFNLPGGRCWSLEFVSTDLNHQPAVKQGVSTRLWEGELGRC